MVPLEERVKWAERENKDQDPLDFFREQYDAHTTRGELQKQDRSLYQRLRKDGLLDSVPVQQVRRDFGDNHLAYYQEHYAGLTRGELAKQDPSLYQRLWKEGLLDNVPTKGRKANTSI